MHQLTGDFFTVGEILGHTLSGIGVSLGISTNLEATTARYIDVRLEKKNEVLGKYHKTIHADGAQTGAAQIIKEAKIKTKDIER